MIFSNSPGHYDIKRAYDNMFLNEANDKRKKEIQKGILNFIKAHKGEFVSPKELQKANKFAEEIPNKDDLDLINDLADFSNLIKDSSKFEKELKKFVDMV